MENELNMKKLMILVLFGLIMAACASQPRYGGPYYQCGHCMCSTDGQTRACN